MSERPFGDLPSNVRAARGAVAVSDEAMRLAPAVEGLIAALLRNRLVEIEPSPLTTTQHIFLAAVADEGATRLNALATRTGTSNATATRTADALVAAGLVKRLADPADGRGVLIVATARGRQLIRTTRKSLAHMLTRLLDAMGDQHAGPTPVVALHSFCRGPLAARPCESGRAPSRPSRRSRRRPAALSTSVGGRRLCRPECRAASQ